MSDVGNNNSAGVYKSEILMVGDISRAFLDADAVSQLDWVIHNNILDAINAAAQGRFKAIGVVMSGSSERLSSGLKALRDSCDARIILLSQMYEEPIVRRLLDLEVNDRKVADDYLICPTRIESFLKCINLIEPDQEKNFVSSMPLDERLEKKLRLLEKLATEDDLTGLKNRRYIWEFLRQIIEHATKEKGRVTLLVFDIDDFKHYNDLYGHSVGDRILQQAANLIKRCCRGHDVVGRIGGDEFAVVFWDDPAGKSGEDERRVAMAEPPKEVIFIANRFRRELEKAELGKDILQKKQADNQFDVLGPKGRGVLTISGGLASFPRDGLTSLELFQRADQALLEAKRSGKNRIYLVGEPISDVSDIS